jgi:hypothetical protein
VTDVPGEIDPAASAVKRRPALLAAAHDGSTVPAIRRRRYRESWNRRSEMRHFTILLALLLLFPARPLPAQQAVEHRAEAAAPAAEAGPSVLPAEPGPEPGAAHSDRAAGQPAAEQGGDELRRFLYNVAVGVAVAVLSTLILRAIL